MREHDKEQCLDLAGQAIDLFWEFHDKHGYDPDRARAAALLELHEALSFVHQEADDA